MLELAFDVARMTPHFGAEIGGFYMHVAEDDGRHSTLMEALSGELLCRINEQAFRSGLACVMMIPNL